MTAEALWIVRHARRRDFDDPRWAETAPRPHDPPLSEAGRAQAEQLALDLDLDGEGIAQLFCSPFLRCVETAAPLAERLDLPLQLEPGLSEWLNRDWFDRAPELVPIAELARRFPRIDASYRPRGAARYGESGEQALQRSGEVARVLVAEGEGTLALVGHGASVVGALTGLLGPRADALPELDYGWATLLRSSGAGWRVARAPQPPGVSVRRSG